VPQPGAVRESNRRSVTPCPPRSHGLCAVDHVFHVKHPPCVPALGDVHVCRSRLVGRACRDLVTYMRVSRSRRSSLSRPSDVHMCLWVSLVELVETSCRACVSLAFRRSSLSRPRDVHAFRTASSVELVETCFHEQLRDAPRPTRDVSRETHSAAIPLTPKTSPTPKLLLRFWSKEVAFSTRQERS
jgi:hypothetical protein